MIKQLIKNSMIWHNPKERVPAFIHTRMAFVFYAFFAVYGGITLRLCYFMLPNNKSTIVYKEPQSFPRFDILDRNGEILATDIITYSIYTDPKAILDLDETVNALAKVLPQFSKVQLRKKLTKKGRFIWLLRHVDPALKDKIFNLGLSGIFFKEEFKRIYPHGTLVSHIVGHCDIDNTGLSGIERSFDAHLKNVGSVQLSTDLRVQHVVRSALRDGVMKYKARGGNAIIMDQTGQILSSVSFPDFSPDNVTDIKHTFDRNRMGCYELGSVFKMLNVAIALQKGVINKNSTFDATKPVKIGRFTVDDFRPKRRILSLEEAFVYSSNIAMILMANHYGDRFGINTQRDFFKRLGIFDKAKLEVRELAYPIIPKTWSKPLFQSLSYGYGIALPPVSFLKTVASVLTNERITPTLLKREKPAFNAKVNIFSKSVIDTVERLMREVVLSGSGKKANLPEYYLVGKTGTALHCINGRYDQNTRNTTFISCLSDKMTGRRFFLLVMLEAPQPVEGTFGFATAGWNCVPIACEIIKKGATLLGVTPMLPEGKSASTKGL